MNRPYRIVPGILSADRPLDGVVYIDVIKGDELLIPATIILGQPMNSKHAVEMSPTHSQAKVNLAHCVVLNLKRLQITAESILPIIITGIENIPVK